VELLERYDALKRKVVERKDPFDRFLALLIFTVTAPKASVTTEKRKITDTERIVNRLTWLNPDGLCEHCVLLEGTGLAGFGTTPPEFR